MTDQSALRPRPPERDETRDRSPLPNRPPDRTWGGRAEGARCAVCGASLERGEAELEFLSPDGSAPDTYRVHPRCFARWDLARRGASA